jgi:hypothetical protein
VAAILSAGCVCAAGTTNLGWKAGWTPADTSKTDRLAANGLLQLAQFEVFGQEQTSNCTIANAAVRVEWCAVNKKSVVIYG